MIVELGDGGPGWHHKDIRVGHLCAVSVDVDPKPGNHFLLEGGRRTKAGQLGRYSNIFATAVLRDSRMKTLSREAEKKGAGGHTEVEVSMQTTEP